MSSLAGISERTGIKTSVTILVSPFKPTGILITPELDE
jgi:hypothetical protein